MAAVAEDVYYIPRDRGQVIGLNQLMTVPSSLSTVELQALSVMCSRSLTTMERRITAEAMQPLRVDGRLDGLPHGLYYVGPDGGVWRISEPDQRPDLDGTEMDFAVATVEAGCANLDRLRQELERL